MSRIVRLCDWLNFRDKEQKILLDVVIKSIFDQWPEPSVLPKFSGHCSES